GGGAAPAAQEAAPAEEAAPAGAAAPAEAAAEGEAAATTEGKYGPVPADAVPYGDPPELDLGGTVVERLPIDQIVTYKALDSYSEPEWVSELVAAGDLPPVEERLPAEPKVILAGGLSDGIGVYGDAWRDFSACPTAGWNNGAGVTAGWFGIESMSFNYQSLVKTGPLFRADQDVEPFPNLAKSWEWSDDGLELTMHLLEGAKWSDGEPFTADDVMFTWNDLINDPNVVRLGVKGEAFNLNDTPSILEKVDDYTIKWTFAEPFPKQLYYYMDEQDFNISPAHVIEPLHPKNSGTDYVAFQNALDPQNLPAVTMGPWVPVEYKTDELLIMRRNPYFWSVDEAGNQLPYIDEAVYQKGPSGVGRTLCTLAGGCDHTNLENPSSEYVEALTRAQEPDAEFIMNWGPEDLAFNLEINQAINFGITSDRDTAIRELFREDDFRRAVSHALDRDGISQALMRGPFLRAFQGGVAPGSPEFDKESVVYFGYDPDKAMELLAGLGLEDTDGNGILNFTEGPLAGEDVIIGMNTSQDAAETQAVGDQIVAMLAAVGIKVNARPNTSQALNDLNTSGEWDMRVSRVDTMLLPFTNCNGLAPMTPQTPGWHREGSEPRELRDWEVEMVGLVDSYCKSQDPDERKQLLGQYNYLYTLHNYSIGTIIGRKGLALAERFKNVPGGTPPRMYQWVEDAIMSEVIWTAPEDQKEQVRPNTVPVYGE
ncbi:MAG: ABC transporter substrate-binding protein, partial [Caldilineaceae bacterium]|nr:ABC transporter substrate-binding protein [Caldilineaceae bacterium]